MTLLEKAGELVVGLGAAGIFGALAFRPDVVIAKVSSGDPVMILSLIAAVAILGRSFIGARPWWPSSS